MIPYLRTERYRYCGSMPWRLHLDVRSPCGSPQALAVCGVLLLAHPHFSQAAEGPTLGIASWYGEAQRGKLMANGRPFNPDELTAASWFYPLGTRLHVRLRTAGTRRSVIVTVTDRGPALRLVQEGRIIDLSRAAFLRLASPDRGLVQVSVAQCDQNPANRAHIFFANEEDMPKDALPCTLPSDPAAPVTCRVAGTLPSGMVLPKDKIFCMNSPGDSLYEATSAGSGSPLCHRHNGR